MQNEIEYVFSVVDSSFWKFHGELERAATYFLIFFLLFVIQQQYRYRYRYRSSATDSYGFQFTTVKNLYKRMATSNSLQPTNLKRDYSCLIEPVLKNNSEVQIHLKKDKLTECDFILPNLSSFCECEFNGILHWALDVLRDKTFLSITLAKKRIDLIESVFAKENATVFEYAASLTKLADLLLQYSMYDGAYYFYFYAATFARSPDPLCKEVQRKALLQIAIMLRVKHITSKTCDTEVLANKLFSYLILFFECEESITFQFTVKV
jgi:hypothetical protein